MSVAIPSEPHRAVIGTAVATTVLIAVGAFILSFAALTDLAQRSGISAQLAWIWPIIVDGMIVAATVAIVALNGHGRRAMVYPWVLLFFGAVVSTAANSAHAILTVDALGTRIPPIVSAVVAAMPPVVLLAITHLTVHMYQKRADAARLRQEQSPAIPSVEIEPVAPQLPTPAPTTAVYQDAVAASPATTNVESEAEPGPRAVAGPAQNVPLYDALKAKQEQNGDAHVPEAVNA